MPRKQHTHHYIYKVTCNVNGKYYIGMHSTSNLDDGYFGSGKRLKYSINKHGKENHSIQILEWLPDRSSLKLRERTIVNEDLLTDPMCMNLQFGGGGGYSGEENQKKWSFAGGLGFSKKLKTDFEFRDRFAELSSTNMKELHTSGKIKYATFTGKEHNVKTKNKIGLANSKSQTGERNSQFGTKWITHPINGIKKVKKADLSNYLKNGWVLGRR